MTYCRVKAIAFLGLTQARGHAKLAGCEDSDLKKPASKAELRQHLNQQTQAFLERGGEIARVERGVSGIDGREPARHIPLFDQPKPTRTPLTDVIRALESRRAEKKKVKPRLAVRRSRRKKVVYDDFGEPLRVVWHEE